MFNENITIIVGNKDNADGYLKRVYKISLLDGKDFIDGCHATYENKQRNERHRIIWLKIFEFSSAQYGLLIHELSHCVNAVLKDIGIKFCEESEEIYTTYLQRLSTEAIWKLRKLK